MKRPLILALSLSMSATAIAQPVDGKEGNGGGGLVCADGVYLYDLFEGAIPGQLTENGLKIIERPEAVEIQIDYIFSKIGRIMSADLEIHLRKTFDQVFAAQQKIPAGLSLVFPADLEAEFALPGCELRGLASYNDRRERLLIDASLYSRMTPTHQAALWIHETIYKFMRKVERTPTSRLTGLTVAYLFSDALESSYREEIFPSNLEGGRFGLKRKIGYSATSPAYIRISTKCDPEESGTWFIHEERVHKLPVFQPYLLRELPLVDYEWGPTPRPPGRSVYGRGSKDHCDPTAEILDQYFRVVSQAELQNNTEMTVLTFY